jgi:hypothetical protein
LSKAKPDFDKLNSRRAASLLSVTGINQDDVMRKAILLLVIFLALLAAPTVYRYVTFYDLFGSTEPAPPPRYDPAQIAPVPTPASTAFVDNPVTGNGLVLLDETHNNNFALADISHLDGRLAARGYELLHYTGGDLARQLRPVNAFITIAPLKAFTSAEIQTLRQFVNRGGRVLMVGDPTRYEIIFDESDPFAFGFELNTNEIPLNSLANEFDLIFNGDYLYNTIENEGNFRNIILKRTGFAEDALVDGLEQLVAYSAHSIQMGPDAQAIIAADENTWSSATDRPGGLVFAASSENGQVLALGDVHFLTNPYYTVYDNSQFIANIADFLTTSEERALTLVDFPYFYQQPVHLIYTGSPDLGAGAFADIIDLQTAFRQANIPLLLAQSPQPGHDVLYLGLYNQAEEVAEILASAGISLTIEPPIQPEMDTETEPEETEIEDAEATSEAEEPDEPAETEETDAEIRLIHSELGNVEMSGTALVVLDESNGRRTTVVLAASREGLANMVNGLLNLIPLDVDAALGGCLLQDPIALCPTLIPNEPVEAELITSGLDVEKAEAAAETEDEDVEPGPEIDATDMGRISLGDTVINVEIAEDESHAWTFNEGPVFLDIVLETSETIDGILEVYDPNNLLIASADSGFSGEGESLFGVEIPDDGDYTIVVRDFFGDAGSYTLTVTESEGAAEGGPAENQSIFLFVDDDGEPIGSGFTSADALLDLLEPRFSVDVWISSVDGPLEEDTLNGYGLIIWDSGDYLNPDGFFDEDASTILNHFNDGGRLFVTGSAPTVFGELPLAPLADVLVVGDDPVLLNGLTAGEVIVLDEELETAVSDTFNEAPDPNTVTFFLRGPESEDEDAIVGFTVDDRDFDQQSVFLLLPFTSLPQDVQPILLNNFLTWFNFTEE